WLRLEWTASGPRVASSVGFEQPGPRHVSVALGRGQAGMAEELLDGTDVGPGLQQVGGERVAEGVGAHAPAGQGEADIAVHHGPRIPGCHALLPSVEEEDIFSAAGTRFGAGQESPPPILKVASECLGREVPHRDDTLLAAF